MYVCGPTVYDDPHIGNARPLVVFDILFKVLKCKYGNKSVTYVRNITDIDDKIIESAKQKKISIDVLTKNITNSFHNDCDYLNCEKPSFEPKATENISLMIEMINVLLKNKNAYEKNSHVYFDVSSFKDYGKLSNKNIDELKAGARVEISENKKNPEDFVLWKPSNKDEPSWESPWGKGRPGWHLECSAMSKRYLGDTFDIHGGGRDLIFPHHENEIAQGSCISTETYCNHWFHNGIVLVDKKKMSKSLGNVILLDQLLKNYDKATIRVALLSAHYRQPLNWTSRTLDNAMNLINKIRGCIKTDVTVDKQAQTEITEILSDDLNTPQAFKYLSDLSKSSKKNIKDNAKLLQSCLFLGLDFKMQSKRSEIDKALSNKVEKLIQKRNKLRSTGHYAEADEIREELSEIGVTLRDRDGQTEWELDSNS